MRAAAILGRSLYISRSLKAGEFGASMANAYAVPPQEGQTAIVTGASGGIGLWTAAGLAKAGAQVVMVCRDAGRGEAARIFAGRGAPRPPELVLADFSDLAAVRDAALQILARHPRIDILVNNAGLFSRKRELTRDGYEMTFAVNHLAPFLFTNTMLPSLESAGNAARRARIVTVASAAAQRSGLQLSDLMSTRRYTMFGAYSQSKLANILFTKELARRLPPRPITANCLHPGVVATRIGNKGGIEGAVWAAIKPFMMTPEQGAVNNLYVSTAPEIESISGAFFVKQRQADANPLASDERIAAALWSESERLINVALTRNAGEHSWISGKDQSR
jgi:NAD(P)-dependent dehydrogenase (short-subunit alcohol dehydrogenase family)